MKKANVEISAKLNLIIAVAIFGSIGIFRRFIPLDSSLIALIRGIVGALSLLILICAKKERVSVTAIKKNLVLLLISGTCIGVNWILLFEAYNYTTVAVATLCYYLAPIFVIMAAPFVLKEKLTLKKGLCIAVALAGMVFVSGVFNGMGDSSTNITGILFGLGAAVLYASVILMNKKIKNISPYDTTIVQLGTAGVILIPYILLTDAFEGAVFGITTVILLWVVGIIHTGFAYALYFGSIGKLKSQTVAVFSYIDPLVAILLSALLLNEPMGIYEIIGAVLILGAALMSEIDVKKKQR